MDIPALFTNKQLTINEVTREYPQSLGVFNRYGIDFCCGGKKNFFKACDEAEAEPFLLIEEISSAETVVGALRFKNWSPVFLTRYIVENHHTYVRQAIPELNTLLDKVVFRHGDNDPKLSQIREQFTSLAGELLLHMDKEEQVLFPAIDELFGGQDVVGPLASNINMPISAMEDDHDHAGKVLKVIRELTNQYTPPASACPTYQLTYQKLEEFDQDLMQHIYLENSVLFSKCLEEQSALTH